MSFTYTPASPNDITRVRFHLADTTEATALFSDDDITFVIAEEGTWQGAVIACLKNLIARVSVEPDYQADWLRVSYPNGLTGLQKMLAIKSAEFGISAGTTSAIASKTVRTTRADWSDT